MSKDALAFLVVGLLLGALPGFLIGYGMPAQEADSPATRGAEPSQMPIPYPVPKTMAECYVAVAKAPTDLGARVMEDYCYDKFDDS